MVVCNHKSRVDVQGGISLTLPYIQLLHAIGDTYKISALQVYEAFIRSFLEESVASATDRVW
jgi:hypothetical protein